MENLAVIHSYEGRYSIAAQIEENLAGIKENLLGEEHSETLLVKSNLADNYRSLGKWEEAERRTKGSG